MTENQEETVEVEEDQSITENREKLMKIGKILLGVTVITIWSVSAGLGLRDIWVGKGVLETYVSGSINNEVILIIALDDQLQWS